MVRRILQTLHTSVSSSVAAIPAACVILAFSGCYDLINRNYEADPAIPVLLAVRPVEPCATTNITTQVMR
jgi:hypothetical protein